MTHPLLSSLLKDEDKRNRPWFQSLHDEIDRVFDDFRGKFDELGTAPGDEKTGLISPRINISETVDTIEISAELPGVGEEDIDVTVADKVLVIKGEKSIERETKEKDYHLIERSSGSFMRSIPLGFEMEDDKVKATIQDGVLSIVIAKPAEIAEKTRKIPISKAA